MNRLEPLSALFGMALAGLCFVTMSQAPVLSTAAVRVEYIPHPRDMVQLEEAAPYTVPMGKILVVTAIGG